MPNMSLKKNEMPAQDPILRGKNFNEVTLGYTAEQAMDEAARCLNCKKPVCVEGCPVQINIPLFLAKAAKGDFEGAYETIAFSSSLPAVCGRVCPQETQCEGKCVRGIKGEPVGIGRVERFVADLHNANTAAPAEKPASNGHRVAVVGSGPSGLTCAGDLAKKGYEVTVFEAFHTAGGVLVYGIPEFRLPKAIVAKEIEGLKALGVEIVTNVAHRIGIQEADDLYNTIGYGGLSVSKLVTKLRDEFDRVVGVPETTAAPGHAEQMQAAAKKQASKNIKNNSGIIVDGERGCQVKFAKCCNPLPGDPVVGFITKGFGISIHKQDCPNVRSSRTSPENAVRWVDARWDDSFDMRSGTSVFEAHLQIHAHDRNLLLADVTLALADMKVAIMNIFSQKAGEGRVILNITVSCKNREHYDSIVSRLKSINDVIDVVRGFS